MDNLPTIQKPPVRQDVQQPIDSPARTQQVAANTSVRPNDRTPTRSPLKRIITRNSFEIYEDQMDALRKLAYEEKMDGKVGSMSQMVREAIDTYLRKRQD